MTSVASHINTFAKKESIEETTKFHRSGNQLAAEVGEKGYLRSQ